jgi:uncharacterized 2Fe-2S/4Fe-4S cluster protein (DUF4445 family)
MKKQKATKRKVRFNPDNIEVTAKQGDNLLQVAINAGVAITAACGGNGTCGTCKVIIEKGEVESQLTAKLSTEEYERGVRQACQSRIITDVTVNIPVASRLERAVLTREEKEAPGAIATGWQFNPPLRKLYVELPPPTIEDNISDLDRLLRGLKKQYHLSNMSVHFSAVQKLAAALRKGKWKVTVTTLVTALKTSERQKRRLRIIDIQPGDTREQHYSLAFDIGTTTVHGQLLDLTHGRVMAHKIELNRQAGYGADVISRIAYSQKPKGLQKLQQVVVQNINNIIKELLHQTGVDRQNIGHISVAGNTTMTQLLLGLDPKYIRLTPYTPTASFFPPVRADSLGIDVGDTVNLFTFPAVASYVGGDIVSGIVGSGVYQRPELTYYIDIGTNGEIVLGNQDWLVTASCSAGPAFEGGGIRHGMVATAGAIEDCDIKPDYEPVVGTIGDAAPKGICGSGLINTVAGLLNAGIIGRNGHFNTDLDTDRVREGEDGYEYVICRADETATGQDIVITEVDIDNLMRAKAAMYAGCQTLTKSVSLTCADIERVIIAGAFGNSINVENSITIGLLPDLPRDRFTFIGNGSLLGARLTSFSTDILDDARRVAGMMTNFELSENTDFMNNYIAALFLPHTHTGEFPSVMAGERGSLKTQKGGLTV